MSDARAALERRLLARVARERPYPPHMPGPAECGQWRRGAPESWRCVAWACAQ